MKAIRSPEVPLSSGNVRLTDVPLKTKLVSNISPVSTTIHSNDVII